MPFAVYFIKLDIPKLWDGVPLRALLFLTS